MVVMHSDAMCILLQEPRRTQMRDLLEHHGFVNERQVECEWPPPHIWQPNCERVPSVLHPAQSHCLRQVPMCQHLQIGSPLSCDVSSLISLQQGL